MKIINFFKMNDWEIRKLIKFILFIQIILILSIGLSLINVNIPILKELLILINILFLNGILLLRIFRIHKLSNIETVLYSVGLSIASLMFGGMFFNILAPLVGIVKPISFLPITIFFEILTFLFLGLSYLKDKNYNDTNYIDIDFFSFQTIFFILLPFLAVLGTYLFNYFDQNFILMFMFILISLIPIVVAYNKIEPKFYPLAIFSISLTLLFSTSLISNYLIGWDINIEYYFTNLVVNNSYWNITIPDRTNAMLSLTMIAPVISSISGMTILTIFKVIYPLIFSLVPLGLYYIYKKQTNKKMAFFGCLLFIFVFMFFLELPYIAKQEIGELFIVLLIMLMINDKIKNSKRLFLTFVLILSLIASHYSLDFIYIFLVFFVYVIYVLKDLKLGDKYSKFKLPVIEFFFTKNADNDTFKNRYKLQLIIIVVVTIVYYTFVSSAELMRLTGDILLFIPYAVVKRFLSPQFIDTGLTIGKSIIGNISFIMHLLIQFSIIIGLLSLVLRRNGMKFKDDYILFSLVMLDILIITIIFPTIANSLNIERFYQIALIFLSIFAVIGWMELVSFLNRHIKVITTKSVKDISIKLFSLILAIFILLNGGFVYEAFGEKSGSYSLNKLDNPKFNQNEISGAKWLTDTKSPLINKTKEYIVYSDAYRFLLLTGGLGENNAKINKTFKINNTSYVFLGSFNIENGQFVFLQGKNQFYKENKSFVNNFSKIYDNRGAQVFLNVY